MSQHSTMAFFQGFFDAASAICALWFSWCFIHGDCEKSFSGNSSPFLTNEYHMNNHGSPAMNPLFVIMEAAKSSNYWPLKWVHIPAYPHISPPTNSTDYIMLVIQSPLSLGNKHKTPIMRGNMRKHITCSSMVILITIYYRPAFTTSFWLKRPMKLPVSLHYRSLMIIVHLEPMTDNLNINHDLAIQNCPCPIICPLLNHHQPSFHHQTATNHHFTIKLQVTIISPSMRHQLTINQQWNKNIK